MSQKTLAILLISIGLAVEASVKVWEFSGREVSNSPVFNYPPAVVESEPSESFEYAVRLYGADRGGQQEVEVDDKTRLTLFYFEWDRVEVGRLMSIASHAPETCNVAAGFQLKGLLGNRSYHPKNHPVLEFDCTQFTDPAGNSIFVFKMPWIQGIGSWHMRDGHSPRLRLRTALTRHVGAARVLQAGIFGAADVDEAWQMFESEVLEKLEWR